MRRCRGKIATGLRCKKRAADDSSYCTLHGNQAPKKSNIGIGIATGIAAGVIRGGVPGAVIGAIVGGFIGKATGKEVMSKTKVFISFDYDNDSDLKTLLVGQSKHEDTPFEISDWSVKEHLPGDWKEKVRSKLKKVDQVVVICGEKTHTATGVSDEIKLAQEEGIPYFLLNGRAEKTCYKPKAAKSSDKLYRWTWPNLKTLIGGGR